MKYFLYAVKDTKVGFMPPFIQVNEAVAVREFGNMINKVGSQLNINYNDMELYELGSFDLNNGDIVSDVRYVIKGADVYKVGAVE